MKCDPVKSIHSAPIKEEAEANPLQAWRGPEGSRRVRLPDLKTIGT
jgi:hypothetical protein